MGQSFLLSMDGLRDDIPSTHSTFALQATGQPASWLYLTVGARQLRIDQEASNGLPQFDERLQTGYAEMAALLGQNAALTVGGALSKATDGETSGDYRVRGQLAIPWSATARGLTTTFVAEIARARETSVATALAENIFYDRIGGGVDLRVQRLTGAARFFRDNYSDDNTKQQAYAYGMLQIVNSPAISLGYAYAFADSDVDNRQVTGTTFDGSINTYHYHQAYVPYFTPIQERGHAALGSIAWKLPGGASLGASANVPFSSQGSLRHTPESGSTPQPPAPTYQLVQGILPVQASATASLPLGSRLTAGLRYGYFRKTYYNYQSGGVGLQLNF